MRPDWASASALLGSSASTSSYCCSAPARSPSASRNRARRSRLARSLGFASTARRESLAALLDRDGVLRLRTRCSPTTSRRGGARRARRRAPHRGPRRSATIPRIVSTGAASTRRSGRPRVDAVAQRADHRGRPRRVVVVEALVRLVVDRALVALALEIVERTQQEVALALESFADSSAASGIVRHHASGPLAADRPVVVDARPTSASSSSVACIGSVAAPAAERDERARRPPTSDEHRQPPHQQPEPVALGLEQDRLAVAVDVRLPDLGVGLALGDPVLQVAADGPRRLTSASRRRRGSRSRGSGAPHASDRARSASLVVARRPRRPHEQRRPRPRRAGSTGPSRPAAPLTGRSASGAADEQLLEVVHRRRPELVPHDQTVGTDRERLGLTRGAERQRRLAARVRRDRPVVARSPAPSARPPTRCRRARCPTSTKFGSSAWLA